MSESVEHPIREGFAGSFWCVAYAALDGAIDVIAFKAKRVPAGVSKGGATFAAGVELGECVCAGRYREKWISTIGTVPGAVTQWAKAVAAEKR